MLINNDHFCFIKGNSGWQLMRVAPTLMDTCSNCEGFVDISAFSATAHKYLL